MNLFVITQKDFYKHLEKQRVSMLYGGFTSVDAFKSLNLDILYNYPALNTGVLYKRSRDFYRATPDGNSYGELSGATIYSNNLHNIFIVYKTFKDYPEKISLLIYRKEV